MRRRLVLVHSPSVGPGTWAPVARWLRAKGWLVCVPDLRAVADGPSPFWPRVTGLVTAAIRELDEGSPLVVAMHSNAGLFAPQLVAASPVPVAGLVFVDAAIPPEQGAAEVIPPDLLEQLRAKAVDGRLPRWSEWWADDEVAALFPDDETRKRLTAEEARLPLGYFEQPVPAAPGWTETPCAYRLFGPPYVDLAEQAAAKGSAGPSGARRAPAHGRAAGRGRAGAARPVRTTHRTTAIRAVSEPTAPRPALPGSGCRPRCA